MNEFVVRVNGNKKQAKIVSDTKVLVEGKTYEVEIEKVSEHLILIKHNNKLYEVTFEKKDNERFNFSVYGRFYEVTARTSLREKAEEFLKNKTRQNHHDKVLSPMPGLVLKVLKAEGDKVELGESVLILEAMKMENNIKASTSGIISKINVSKKQSIEKNTLLFEIE